MVTGYGGTYRAVVVDDADPMQQNRLGVIVPDVYGDDVSVWAAPLSAGASPPPIGDLVLISFELGDTDHPIWEPNSNVDNNDGPAAGYIGKYRGLVVSNDDPMQEDRLEVTVPDVTSEVMWALPSGDVRYSDTPDVGAEVWIEYEYGNPEYPRWVGLA